MQAQKLKQNKPTFLEPPEWDEAWTLGEEDAVPGSPGRSPNSPHPTRQAPGCPRPCEALLATPSLPQVARNLAQLVLVWCWPESRPMGLRQGTTRLFTVLKDLWMEPTPDSSVETVHPASMVLALWGHASGLDGPCFLPGPPSCADTGTALTLSPIGVVLLGVQAGLQGWSPRAPRSHEVTAATETRCFTLTFPPPWSRRPLGHLLPQNW